jgi:hypothetical protein
MHPSTFVIIAGLGLAARWFIVRRRRAALAGALATPAAASTRGDTPSLAASGERLIRLITPDPVTRESAESALAAAFVASEHSSDDDLRANEDGQRIETGDDLLWMLREILDWKSLFYVDWKDRESLVQSVNAIATPWGVTVDWGVPDPESEDFLSLHTVDELMPIAHASLSAQGFDLWNWATDGDCYSGWIARAKDADAIMEISREVDVAFRTGDRPF